MTGSQSAKVSFVAFLMAGTALGFSEPQFSYLEMGRRVQGLRLDVISSLGNLHCLRSRQGKGLISREAGQFLWEITAWEAPEASPASVRNAWRDRKVPKAACSHM